MNPLAILWLWRIGGALLLSGSLTAAYFGWAKHEQNLGAAPYIAKIAQQKTEAAQVLAIKTAEAAAATKALQDFKNTQELQDADHKKTVAALNARLHSLAGPAGRLRDPNQTGCGGGSRSAPGTDAAAPGDRAGDGADAGGVLSADLSGLLLRLTKSADDINLAYISCRADAFAVRAQP